MFAVALGAVLSCLVKANRNKYAHCLAWVSLVAPLVGGAPVEVWYRGGRGFGRGCLSERCRTLQSGGTPLLAAAERGRAKVVGKLLAAGAAKDAADGVRRGGGDEGRRKGRVEGERAPLRAIFFVLARKYPFTSLSAFQNKNCSCT